MENDRDYADALAAWDAQAKEVRTRFGMLPAHIEIWLRSTQAAYIQGFIEARRQMRETDART